MGSITTSSSFSTGVMVVVAFVVELVIEDDDVMLLVVLGLMLAAEKSAEEAVSTFEGEISAMSSSVSPSIVSSRYLRVILLGFSGLTLGSCSLGFAGTMAGGGAISEAISGWAGVTVPNLPTTPEGELPTPLSLN